MKKDSLNYTTDPMTELKNLKSKTITLSKKRLQKQDLILMRKQLLVQWV